MVLDTELGEVAPHKNVEQARGNVIQISSFDNDSSSSVETQVDALLERHAVVMITLSWCPFSKDVKKLLTEELQVQMAVLHTNEMPQGPAILAYAKHKANHKTVPMIFVKGQFVGGCDQVNVLYENGRLEQEVLRGLMKKQWTVGTDQLETSHLQPLGMPQRPAYSMPFWFPHTTNNNVVRATGMQVFCLAVLSVVFFQELWGRYVAVGLLVDFGLRMVAGSFASPLGMVATLVTCPWKPDFRPGPPKQFAAFCGLFFSLNATVFYFCDFEGHEIVGAAFMGGLACASGMEGFLDFCLGCLFFGWGIQYGLIPDTVYRLHTATRPETLQSYEYKFSSTAPSAPVGVETDPHNPIALKYKIKSDEWTKDDFHVVRNMQVSYFGLPLSLSGLAVAFRLASSWSSESLLVIDERSILVPALWYQVPACAGALVFALALVLYATRAWYYPKKCIKEWYHPLHSSGFGMLTIGVLLNSFLIASLSTERDGLEHSTAKVLFWMGAVGHAWMTVAKVGEWVSRRLELEHVHPQWMILPVGLGVAALVAPLVLDRDMVLVGRFFLSFAMLLWVTLFVISFFKVVTEHNSDNRIRHGVWIWVAAPCVLGLADWSVCRSSGRGRMECEDGFYNLFFIGMFLFMSLAWATLPHYAFFGREPFNMGYWIECFAIDTLAACCCLFYGLYGYDIAQTLQFMTLVAAAVANAVCFLHTLVGVAQRRGIFTPEVKWGPLSFMKLTHEAFRGSLGPLKLYMERVDLDNDTEEGKEVLGLFAAHLNRFRIVHHEHAKHEDEIIFKTFDDLFPEHARKYTEDHAEDHASFEKWTGLANQLLDVKLPVQERKAALEELRADLTTFFPHFEQHMRGEEDNLNPIGRKHVPLALMKQMSRRVWESTPASRWEIILPFIVRNLPRHMQRVRYVKVLCWSMPERCQQIGSILYRNIDAVTWEKMRKEVPEMIPRGLPNHQRYY